ncbi:MAG TPA: DUF6496 domain-containing protein [Acidobacteriota bacterium]
MHHRRAAKNAEFPHSGIAQTFCQRVADWEIVFWGETAMAKYGKKASEKVEKAMHERKKGTLKSGRSGKKVKSRKQAIAIGLSQARRAGAKVPPKKSSSKKKK